MKSFARERWDWIQENRFAFETHQETARRWYHTVYLKSERWRSLRATAIRQANGKCQICGTAEKLRAHHKTYERLGREDPTDLRVLCDRCHRLQHYSRSGLVTGKSKSV